MDKAITLEQFKQCADALEAEFVTTPISFLEHLTSIMFYQRHEDSIKKNLKPEYWSIANDEARCERLASIWNASKMYLRDGKPNMANGVTRYYFTEDGQLDAFRFADTLKELYKMVNDDYVVDGHPAKNIILKIAKSLGLDIETSPDLPGRR